MCYRWEYIYCLTLWLPSIILYLSIYIYSKLHITYFKQFYQECSRQNIPVHVHKHQLFLLEQHSESFKSWSAIIRINTDGNSLVMKLGLVGQAFLTCKFQLQIVINKHYHCDSQHISSFCVEQKRRPICMCRHCQLGCIVRLNKQVIIPVLRLTNPVPE